MLTLIETNEVIQSIAVEDVTNDQAKISIAFGIAAANYAKFSDQSITINDVYKELCEDIYHREGLARTLLATGLNPNSGELSPLATIRIVIGSKRATDIGIAPLEAMGLVSPLGGWTLFQPDRFDPLASAEFGRFSIVKEVRNNNPEGLSMSSMLTKKVVDEAKRIASAEYGKKQILAIMPFYVAKLVNNAGIKLSSAWGISLNYQHHEALFKKYSKYWIDRDPMLYELLP